jgi:uncharacterized membrane protein
MPRVIDDHTAIEARLKAVEAATGAQVVVAMVRRSSAFHGLRWRAFALGAVAAALVTVLEDWVHPQFITGHAALINAMVVIGVGVTLAVLATFMPAFERLFLQRTRAEAAVRQRAQVLFLARELFATPARNAVLLLAGRFERAVAVYADTAYAARITDAEWQRVVAAMSAGMQRHDTEGAFLAGLDALEALLRDKGFAAGAAHANALSDQVIDVEDGPA